MPKSVSTSELPPSYFFVHVMKVGGFSLARMIRTEIFSGRELYPHEVDGHALEASISYPTLRNLPEQRRREIRFYSGHFPFAASQTLGSHIRTFALFRDPVERVVSHIKHFKQRTPGYKDRTLEEIYQNPPAFAAYLDNLQLRAFAIDSIAQGGSMFEPTRLSESDIERALDRVDRVDVVGLTEDFADSVRLMATEFGWSFRRPLHINQGLPIEVPDELRERIREDHALDRAFYEKVREKYWARKRDFIARRPLVEFTDPVADG